MSFHLLRNIFCYRFLFAALVSIYGLKTVYAGLSLLMIFNRFYTAVLVYST